MKIVGFGDSFILRLQQGNPLIPHVYEGILRSKYNADVDFRGVSGTGPWSAFFNFLDYMKNESVPDVVIFVWSDINRLYNNFMPVLNESIANRKVTDTTDINNPVYKAAIGYYKHFALTEKPDIEMSALMNMYDHMVLDFPLVKFINLHVFSQVLDNKWEIYDSVNVKDIKYFHRFENCAEVRPPLMLLSRKDEWPQDLSKENRECHLSLKMHKLLANAIMNA